MTRFDWIFLAGVALWLVETGMFGWNAHAKSIPENMFDAVSTILMVYGFIGGLIAAGKKDVFISLPRKK